MALGTRQRDLSPMFDALADDKLRPSAYTRLHDHDIKYDNANANSNANNGSYVPPVGGDGNDGMQRSATSSIVPLEGGALQSPWSAYNTIYFKINIVFSVIFNIGINLGFGYWGRDNDLIGLWDTPQPSVLSGLDTSTSRIALDMTVTSVLVVFFTTLLTAGGIKGEVKKGKLAPIPDYALCYDRFKYVLPIRHRGLCGRSLYMAVFHLIVWLSPWLAFFGILCQSGAMNGDNGDQVCQMPLLSYIWFKAFWAGATAAISYPHIFVAALNRDMIPDDIMDIYMEKFELSQQNIAVIDSPNASVQ